ncbi:MAG: branched-chain amino acid ABC transporter permease [Sneathiellaceae bacterium]
MNALFEIFISGLFSGSLYAMMAVGLALIWTTIGVFNFGQGIFATLAAYLTWQLVDAAGFELPLFVSIVLALAVMAVIGWLFQLALVRPFIGQPGIVLTVVITTLAAFTILENITLLLWGPRPKQLPPLIPGNAEVLGFGIAAHQLAIIVITPLILLAVWLFLNRTRTGLALRAVSQNEDASLLAGLNVPMMYALAFALSAVLAGLAGVFFGGLKFMSPTMGTEPLVKALVVVIFGGIANLTGPILAAYLIAFFEAAATYFIGFYWTPALLFLVLIVTLMVRPEGLLTGRSRRLT